MFPLAHASHWLVSLLYVAPVVILIGGLLWQRRRDGALPDGGDPDDVFADGAWDDDLGTPAGRD